MLLQVSAIQGTTTSSLKNAPFSFAITLLVMSQLWFLDRNISKENCNLQALTYLLGSGVRVA